MTSYIIEIKECPKCKCLFSSYQLNSCNTIGAIYYTDGAIYGPMYGEGNALIACPSCNSFFWRENLPTLKRVSESNFIRDTDLKLLPQENFINKRAFISLLDKEFWETSAQEKYIRTKAWWAYNDIYRGKAYNEFFLVPEKDYKTGKLRKDKTEEDFKLSFEGKANLLKLLPLLDMSNIDDIIRKSEVFRELGQFDDCINLLNQPFSDSDLVIVNAIRDLAINRKQMVAQIFENASRETHLFR
jgi:hypothetical protein